MYYLLLTTYYLQRDRTDGRVYHPLLLREAVQRLAERRAPGECVCGGGGGYVWEHGKHLCCVLGLTSPLLSSPCPRC